MLSIFFIIFEKMGHVHDKNIKDAITHFFVQKFALIIN